MDIFQQSSKAQDYGRLRTIAAGTPSNSHLTERNALIAPAPIAPPGNLYSRDEVLRDPSPVPAANGLYAWYFRDFPVIVPSDNCLTVDGKTLLYIGIAPDKQSKPNSSARARPRPRR